MIKHPYQALPQYTRWSRVVAGQSIENVDPVVGFPFRILASDRVATAGSCFAQHIARHLKQSGFTYYVVEDGHPLGAASVREKFNYGVFSARYANLYTSRQLLQLFKRSYGTFQPIEDIWKMADDQYVDPFRPNIQPRGFQSQREVYEDRRQHFTAVRRMFEGLDYFVFTLGLTECWKDLRDGAVFPVCPGVAGGTFDEKLFAFQNLTVQDVVEDMSEFVQALASVNPHARIITTVSPVPLIATAMDRHVLVSTTYSKSVLRVACEELCQRFGNVAYFPSYEIITGSYAQSKFFASDLRSITEEGVEKVMQLFLRHATRRKGLPIAPSAQEQDDFVAEMSNVVKAICEEELIEASFAKGDLV